MHLKILPVWRRGGHAPMSPPLGYATVCGTRTREAVYRTERILLTVPEMPLCEGLPTGPWPRRINNNTVKLSQSDLMLCSSCESSRFPKIGATINQANHASSGTVQREKYVNSRKGRLTDKSIQPLLGYYYYYHVRRQNWHTGRRDLQLLLCTV